MKFTKSDKTKQFIIAQSSAVFNTKGYTGTSLQDIMNVTGLTKGGIYGNFKSKEEIAYLVFDYNVRLVMDQVRQKIMAEDNAKDKLLAIVNFYKNYYYKPPVAGGCPMLNLAIEVDDTHPGLRIKVVEALTVLRESVKSILIKGQKYNQVNSEFDVNRFSTLFLAIVEGGIMMSRTFQEPKYLNECLAHLIDMINNIKA